MILVGRKIYYEKLTGYPIVDTGERRGSDAQETTRNEDFALYRELSERVSETVGMIRLEYGQYAQDFEECNGYRVNPQTLEIEFSYPDPNEPEAPPIYRKPLTEQMIELKAKYILVEETANSASLQQQELIELLIDMGVI